MTEDGALAASEALLSLAGSLPMDPARVVSSGLVEQQRLFHRHVEPR